MVKGNKGALQCIGSKVYCNCCSREIKIEGKDKEDYLEVAKVWGYFSSKDLIGQTFKLCESCYDQFISRFKIPVQEYVVDDIPVYTEEQLRALNEAYAKELSK